ncbi:MAG: hypothetical protein GY815_09755, partial [Gammaproteobacteria bacterium]|nr:hypothetical protein [Gammaproteobacteria bacterium]
MAFYNRRLTIWSLLMALLEWRKEYCTDRTSRIKSALLGLLLLCPVFPGVTFSAAQGPYQENLSGYYAREGNGGSPAQAAGSNIYIRFFPDRWLAMLFLPYPYA